MPKVLCFLQSSLRSLGLLHYLLLLPRCLGDGLSNSQHLLFQGIALLPKLCTTRVERQQSLLIVHLVQRHQLRILFVHMSLQCLQFVQESGKFFGLILLHLERQGLLVPPDATGLSLRQPAAQDLQIHLQRLLRGKQHLGAVLVLKNFLSLQRAGSF